MMKIKLTLIAVVSIMISIPVISFSQAGTLDETFGTDGIAIFAPSPVHEMASDVISLDDTSSIICGAFQVIIEECIYIGENTVEKVKAYPNPAKDILNVKLMMNENPISGEIIISNSYGQVMETRKLSQRPEPLVFNVSGYHSGIYTLQIRTKKNIISARFMVVK